MLRQILKPLARNYGMEQDQFRNYEDFAFIFITEYYIFKLSSLKREMIVVDFSWKHVTPIRLGLVRISQYG